MQSPPIENAIISVSDKLGLADFARGLVAAGVTIYSTGGTGRHLENEGIEVRDISAYTGFPEMMDGRLKTLHPKVFGGLLCRYDREDDMAAIAEQGIEKFALVVVNLYPFEATVAREGVTLAEAIEKIDIGGPSLIRAAAKNHAFTTIATDPEQYAAILEEVAASGATTLKMRRRLAAAAFSKTAAYERAITDYFAQLEVEDTEELPLTLHPALRRRATLRYGENPHQKAAVYADATAGGADLVSARQLNGKALSYNNLLDLDSALSIARSFDSPAVVVIKHNNPCGVATADAVGEAAKKAMAGDPVSAFGSVLGFNVPVDAEAAQVLATPGQFIEAIAAPEFSPEALEILTTKPKWKNNVRLMQVGSLDTKRSAWQTRWIEGGMLVQGTDIDADPEDEWTVPTKTQPTDEQKEELRFAWEVVRHVKSNAIVVTKDRALLGAGAGQMSRVDSVEIAIKKAGSRVAGCVMASDAFFPFDDSIHRAAEAGVTAIIQPGGSKGDESVIAACDKHGLAMIFTGRRHFKH